jgi:hypothetical protein
MPKKSWKERRVRTNERKKKPKGEKKRRPHLKPETEDPARGAEILKKSWKERRIRTKKRKNQKEKKKTPPSTGNKDSARGAEMPKKSWKERRVVRTKKEKTKRRKKEKTPTLNRTKDPRPNTESLLKCEFI